MIQASKLQKAIIAIIAKGDKEFKKLLVQEATGDATKTSTNDLTHAQANAILAKFDKNPVPYDNWAFFDKNNRSHKYLISLAIQYGWSEKHPTYGEVANLGKLSEWLKSDRAPVQKKLKQMTTIEVSKTISALESMIKKKYK